VTPNSRLNLIPKSLPIIQTYIIYSDFDEDVDDDFIDDQVDEEVVNEELGNDIIESSTLISPKITPVIVELVDVFVKDVTHNDISQTLLSHLSIVSTALSQKK